MVTPELIDSLVERVQRLYDARINLPSEQEPYALNGQFAVALTELAERAKAAERERDEWKYDHQEASKELLARAFTAEAQRDEDRERARRYIRALGVWRHRAWTAELSVRELVEALEEYLTTKRYDDGDEYFAREKLNAALAKVRSE